MDRTQTLSLEPAQPVLAERFGVRRLAFFGSVTRGTARPDSDVDVLLGFDQPPTGDQYFGTQFYLEAHTIPGSVPALSDATKHPKKVRS